VFDEYDWFEIVGNAVAGWVRQQVDLISKTQSNRHGCPAAVRRGNPCVFNFYHNYPVWLAPSTPSFIKKGNARKWSFFIVFDEYDWFEIVGNAVAGWVRQQVDLISKTQSTPCFIKKGNARKWSFFIVFDEYNFLHRKIFAQIDLFYTWVGGDFTGGAFL